MDRAHQRLGVIAALALAGGAAWWLWQPAPSSQDQGSEGVAVVAGRAANISSTDRVVVASSPAPSPMPRAADPVVAARRDTPVLAAVAGKVTPDANVLDGAMARQDRHDVTAAPTETAMRVALMNVPVLAGGSETPRVLCVDTTCEVTGVAAAGRSSADVEQALRDPAMLHAMVARGYMPGPATVATAPGGGVSYVLYLNDKMGSRATMARQ